MPIGLATAAIAVAAVISKPVLEAPKPKVETPKPSTEIVRMELTRYQNEKVILYYRRCDQDEGRLAVYEAPKKKPVKGCWYTDLGSAQIVWANGKSNIFDFSEFNIFTKDAPDTSKQLGDE